MSYTFAALTGPQRNVVIGLSMYAEPVWWPQFGIDTGLRPTLPDLTRLVDLGYVDHTTDPGVPIETLQLADRGWRWLIEAVTRGTGAPPDATAGELNMWAGLANVHQHARRRGVTFAEVYRPTRRRWAAAAPGSGHIPRRAIRPGGTHCDHHLGDHDVGCVAAVDRLIVEATDGEAACPGATVLAIGRLLAYAPRPDETGADDWERPKRADEDAYIWGHPMTEPDIRARWLRRADEIAAAAGTPLFGEAGLTRGPIKLYES